MSICRCGATFRKHAYYGVDVPVCSACNLSERAKKAAYAACWTRDNGKCVQCHKAGAHVHHITFVCFGGKSVLSNLVLLCEEHHKALHAYWILAHKGDADYDEIYTKIEAKLRSIVSGAMARIGA